jgi:ATP adenylyltransferase
VSEILFEPGTLWKAIERCSAEALCTGALEPIGTETRVIEADGVRFVARMVTQLERKLESQTRQRSSGVNPFLPPEAALVPCEISDTHVCVLNKFSILENHALIVTRRFEEQSSPLGATDFEAAWACLREADALVFYNSGPGAGASQPHRHLQLVRLPQGMEGDELPISPLVAQMAREADIGRIAALPFDHGFMSLEDCRGLETHAAARSTLDRYRALQRTLDCDAGTDPYNLMMTRDWIYLVPRSAPHWRRIPSNALGFVGILMVRDQEQFDLLSELGPMTLLRETGRRRIEGSRSL